MTNNVKGSLALNERQVAGAWARIVRRSVRLETGCLIFAGGRVFGYGKISAGNREHRTHRVSWMHNRGEIPDGIFVCHDCDTRACVEPAHLFLGTNADNQRDMVEKGLSRRGEKHPSARLRPSQVLEIRASEDSARTLATRHRVSYAAIWDILARRRWRHI